MTTNFPPTAALVNLLDDLSYVIECLAEDLTGEAKHKLSILTGKLAKDPTYSISDSERIIGILRKAREDLVVLKKGESALKLTSLSRQLWSVVRRQ